MPGIRDGNFRSGDIAESLGTLLLQSVALVAPVPRPEDVGVDVFGTLLRPDTTRRLVPDLSFITQLKAESVKEIRFDTVDQTSWLVSCELPLFFGRVSLSSGSIKLYPTHELIRFTPTGEKREYDLIRISFSEPTDLHGHRQLLVNLGDPVLEWTLQESLSQAFKSHAFALLSEHISLMRRNLASRAFGYYTMVSWRCGDLPIINGTTVFMGGEGSRKEANDAIVTPLRALIASIDASDLLYDDLLAVHGMIGFLRRRGIDIDRWGNLLGMLMIRADGPRLSIAQIIELRLAALPAATRGGVSLDGVASMTDEAVQFLPETLTWLNLSRTAVTDAAASTIARITTIRRLILDSTSISDSSVSELSRMTQLEYLSIKETAVSAEGVKALRHALTHAEIVCESSPS